MEPTDIQNPENQNPDPANTGLSDEEEVPTWQLVLNETHQRASNADRLRLEAENRANELARQLEETRRQQQQNNRVPLQEGDAFNNPEGFANRLMADVAEQVRPLNNFVAEEQRRRDYYTNRNTVYQRQPQLGAFFSNQQALSYLDNLFISDPSRKPTELEIVREIKGIIADLFLSSANNPGNNNNNNTRTTTQTNPNPPVQPPNSPPSTRRSVNNNNNTNTTNQSEPDLTENERRLAREKGQTPQEFIIMRDTPDKDISRVWKELKAKRKANKDGGQ